jgi:D-beta-D-heptose 7-phosphate kinase/D-beta-D-heptose 1-phosphate adenosyltransferase
MIFFKGCQLERKEYFRFPSKKSFITFQPIPKFLRKLTDVNGNGYKLLNILYSNFIFLLLRPNLFIQRIIKKRDEDVENFLLKKDNYLLYFLYCKEILKKPWENFKGIIKDEETVETLKGLKEMAMGDLERIGDYAEMISDRMEEGQELDSWMYSQITLAVDQLNSVHDTMDGNDGVKESVNEVSTNPADIIKDLDKVRHDLIKKVDVLIAKKKKLYANVDITTPMSADEKQLDKDIQSIFSQIQGIIQQKRKIKNETVIKEDENTTDDESGMFISNIKSTMESAQSIQQTIQSKGEVFNVPAWVQAKTALASDYLNSIDRYYKGNPNNDNWLLDKKGYFVLDEKERATIVSAIKWVDGIYITKHKRGEKDRSVCEALKKIKPHVFANGGDRFYENVPEVQVCKELKIEMVFNVGGKKLNSSSTLIKRAAEVINHAM